MQEIVRRVWDAYRRATPRGKLIFLGLFGANEVLAVCRILGALLLFKVLGGFQ